MSETTSFTWSTPFDISLPSLHDYDMKLSYFALSGEHEQKNFTSSIQWINLLPFDPGEFN